MKITKYGHSCVLVETANRVGLFDPGNFAWMTESFDISKIDRLDDIIITHEHADHVYLPFLQTVLEKFPNVSILTTETVSQQLNEQGITATVTTQPNEHQTLFAAEHESIAPLAPWPLQNIGVHYADVFTHPGDSHHFSETKKVLALPITAPWGTTPDALHLVETLKPEYVLPIHDYLWRPEVRDYFYQGIQAYCESQSATFLAAVDGQPIEIN